MIYDKCTIGTSGKISRSSFIPTMAFLLLALTGCAAPLSPDLEQSLSVVVPTKVDFADLEYYAKRSKAAYDSVSDIRKAFPLATRIVTVKSVGVQYFIETDLTNRNQTLSIRGTAQKPNVWEDIEIALLPDRIIGIPLHRGFRDDAWAVYTDASPYLRKDLPIRVTGHSLGGAVAVIVAAYLEREDYDVDRVVTFGQPKVTSKRPVDDPVDLITRVVNEEDIVPMIPPNALGRKYQHFSPEVILMDGPDYVYLPEHDANRVSVGEFWRNISHLSVKDHQMDKYLSNIKEKVRAGSKQIPYSVRQSSDTSAGHI
ncbi:MAG: lipase family protein [Sedimentitalea sp.]|uniref:lipase family protein n=2 Tax=Sedimentitalea sp. TaxID=2048915 RepID=UPI003299B8D6